MAHPNARVPREEDEGRQRRRRMDGTLDRMLELRLAVPPHIREQNPGRDFRWINDTGNRIHTKTVMDDWDKVDGIDPQNVGTDKDGRPMKAYLCMKPIEFIREDEARKEQSLRDGENSIIRGATHENDLVGATYDEATLQNRIGRVSA